MRLITTWRIEDGTTLSRDVYNGRPDGVPLLRAGMPITPRLRELLVAAGISAIYVEDSSSRGIVARPAIDDATREVATRTVASAVTVAQRSFATGKPLPRHVVTSLEDSVNLIVDAVVRSGSATVTLADLSCADAYSFQHSIDVATAGLLIGQRYYERFGWLDHVGRRRFGNVEERLSTLGLGLLLHDVGKLAVPLPILNKPGALTDVEWELMRKHPRAGVDLLYGADVNPLVKAVVLRHHERWDGSGYPDGKVGEKVHEMARIAAVADVFDAVTSARPYSPAHSVSTGVNVINDGCGVLFDPDVVAAFREVVFPFPPGCEVDLSDGRSGIVVDVPATTPDRPVVRLLEHGKPVGELALAHFPELAVYDRGWTTPLPSSSFFSSRSSSSSPPPPNLTPAPIAS